MSSLDRPRRRVPAVGSSAVSCPACTTPVDAVSAAGLDLDVYTFGVTTPAYRCPHCRAVPDRVTPQVAFGPGWHWELNRPRLAGRLRRADLYDAGHPTG